MSNFLDIITNISYNTQMILIFAVKSVVVILLLLGVTAFYILVERNILGSIQRRKGPNNVGAYGLLQSVSDGFKLIAKENIIPSAANPGIFIFAPIVTFFLGIAVWAVIPFTEGSVISNINLGVLYLYAVSSLGVFAIIMSGWSSNSKYAFLGATRSAMQMVAYEVSFGLSLLTVFMFTGSLNLTAIVNYQNEVGYLFFPLFPMFLVFFISILAETNRHPFDLPEAEAELVSGYNVEYSSMVFALFFLGEYLSILAMSGLCVILFFGGWSPLLSILDFIPGVIWFALKLFIIGSIFVIVRGVLPRFRFDQLMFLGWKFLLPITLGWTIFIAGFLFFFTSSL